MEGAFPHFTVSVLPYDPSTGEGAFMWRGENVRSAKNCLAIPSGLLEHGEYFGPAIFRELEEELGLFLTAEEKVRLRFRRLYHNMPGDGFHWVIGIWSLPITNLRGRIKNMEPDKHDSVAAIPLELIRLWAKRDLVPGMAPLFAGNLADPLIEIVDQILTK